MNRIFKYWFYYSALALASLSQTRADSMTFYGELAKNKIDVSDLASGEGRALGHFPDLYVYPAKYDFEIIVVAGHKWNIHGHEYEPKVVIKKSVTIPKGVGEYHLITYQFDSRDLDENDVPLETENVIVKLKVIDVETETVATVPSNRKRLKLGVGEEVKLTLKASGLNYGVHWVVQGGGSVEPVSGSETKFTAGHQAGTSKVKAVFSNMEIVNTFNVVEPSGILMDQEPYTEVWHIQGMASVGFRGRAYFKPTDVSFINIEVREQTAPGNGNGYYNFLNGQEHPLGGWKQVIEGTEIKGSKDGTYDQISAGAFPPPFANGTFFWWIPWEYRTIQKKEFVKVFTQVVHYQEADVTGKVTLSKGGVSKSKKSEDPTSDY